MLISKVAITAAFEAFEASKEFSGYSGNIPTTKTFARALYIEVVPI